MPTNKRAVSKPATPTAVPADDVLISAAEAGAMLGGASAKKLRGLVTRGEFRCFRFDGVTRYSRAEVLAFIQRIIAAGPGRAPWRGDGSAAGGDAA